MEKNNIYYYGKKCKPICTVDEQNIIVNWLNNNYNLLDVNGYNRYNSKLSELKEKTNIPVCIYEIKKRIVDAEQLHEFNQEPVFEDSVGYMINGGKLHKHTDPNLNNLVHTRFNVYVQLPEEGGYPIYSNNLYKLKERTYICCRAGIDYHECQEVKGDKARIILSFGFLLPVDRVSKIIYDY
jgi:hypothetical protein